MTMSHFVKQPRRMKSIAALTAAHRRRRGSSLDIERLEDRTVLSTINWNSALFSNGGSWDQGSNWVGGVVPGPNDDAVITLASGTVTVNGSINDPVKSVTTSPGAGLSIASGTLSISSASTLSGQLLISTGGTLSGAGTVTVNGPLVWLGGTMSGTGTTDVKGNFTIGSLVAGSSGLVYLDAGRILNNNGVGTFQGPAGANPSYQMNITNGSTLVNKSAATLNFLGTVGINGDGTAGSGVVNQGTLVSNAASGPNVIISPFANSGTVNVQTGTLTLSGGGTFTGTATALTTAANTLIDFTSGAFTAAAGTVVTESGAGLARLSGATLSFAGTATFANFTETTGTIAGTGKFTVNGQYTWLGGTMTDAGITENRGTLTMGTTDVNGYFQGFIGGGRAFNNYTTATLASGVNYGVGYGLYVSDGSTITNKSGATFNFIANASINNYTGAAGTFINQGTLGTTGGTGSSFVNLFITNSGTIKPQVGTLALNNGGNFTGTTTVLNQSSGAVLDFTNGTFTVAAGTSISGTGAGFVQLDAATLTVNGSASFANFKQTTGTLNGTGTVTITSALIWIGGTMTDAGTTNVNGTDTIGTSAVGSYYAVFLAGGRKFNNGGAGTMTNAPGNNAASLYVSDGSIFTIKAGASFNFIATAALNYGGGAIIGGGTVVNQGTLGTSGASAASYIAIPVTNTGTINVQAGTLSLTSGATFTGTASAFITSAGAYLDFNTGTFTAAAGTVITGTGAGVVDISGGTFNLDGTANLTNFLQSNGTLSGAGPLTTTGLLTWAAGTISGTGITEAKAGLNIGFYAILTGGRSLINDAAGTLNPAGYGYANNYGFFVQDNSTFTNKAGATFTLLSDATIGSNGGAPSFINQGTLATNGGTTTSTISMPVLNSGTINVQTGTLALSNGGTFSGTTALKESANAILDLTGGTFTAAAGTTINSTGAGLLRLSGATVTNAGTASLANFTEMNGTLGGTGSVTVNGLLTWVQGIMQDTGTTEAKGGLNIGYYTFLAGGRKLNNYAAATINPASYGFNAGYGTFVSDGSMITNKAGATWTLLSDAVIGNNGGSPAGGTFNNQGTLTTNGGTSISTISVALNNSGTINVQTGTLAFGGGGTFSGTPTLTESANTILDLTAGTFTAAAGTTINSTGAGLLRLSGATLTNAGTASFANFTQNGGILGGTGSVTVNNVLTWVQGTMQDAGITEAKGGLNIGYSAYLAGGRTLNNYAAATIDPAAYGYPNPYGIFVSDASTITNKAGATFTFLSDATVAINGGSPVFNNFGTVATSGGTGTSTIGITLNNSGTINVQTGILSLSSGGTFNGTSTLTESANTILDLINGQFTSAAGTTINSTGAGLFRLNNAGLSIEGTATFGNFTETNGNLAGTGTVTVNGLLTWAQGFMQGTGSTEAKGGLNIGFAAYLTGGRSLINDAAATLNPASYGYNNNAYGIFVQDASTITNTAGATFTFLSDASITNSGGSPTFINLGTIATNGGVTTSTIGIALNNSSAVNVQTGTLALSGGGTFSGTSTLTESANTILDLTAGTITAAAGTTINSTGAGLLRLSGATLTNAGTASLGNFTETNGTLGGTGAVTVNGLLTWAQGIMQDAGTTEAKSGLNIGYFATLAGGRSLINDAAATLNPLTYGFNGSYGIFVQDASTITNKVGATFTILSDATITNSGGTPSFINQGTLTLNGGTGISTVAIPVTNPGTISVQTGTLNLTGGLTNFNAATSTLAGGTYLIKTKFRFANANIVTNNAAITLNTTASLISDSNAVNALTGFNTNGSGGSVTLQGGRGLTVGTFQNAGVLSIGATSAFKSNNFTQSGGRTVIAGGSLTSATNVININAGIVDGIGTLVGNVTNAGTIRPGGLGVAGTLNITGNYAQTAAGSLVLDIGGVTVGTQYDRLAITGTATLNGTLSESLISAFAPAAGTTFRPLTFASATGDFSTKSGLDLGTRILAPSYDATGLNLVTNIKPTTTAPTPTIAANGQTTVTLTAADTESPASSLVFTITSLPAGTLFRSDGSVVTLGSTFTGSPVTLTYQIPTVIFGNFTDSFKYTVTDNGVPAGTSATTSTSAPATVNLALAAPSAGVATISGTSANDTIVVGASGTNLQVTLNGVVNTTSIAVSSITQLNVYGQAGTDSVTLNGLAVNSNLNVAAGGSLTVTGGSTANTFTINASTVGYNGATISGNTPLTVNGGGGTNTFNIVAANATASLNGGSGTNAFVFSATASLAGTLAGGAGANTIDETAVTTPITLNLATSTLTGLANPFTNIQKVLAGTNSGNSITGPAAGTTFSITSATGGSAAGVAFTGFRALTGGAGNDTFQIANGVTFTGIINGGPGTNTFDDSLWTTAVALNIPAATVTGLSTAYSNITNFVGGTNAGNTITGPAAATTYNITGANTGNFNGVTFSGFGNLAAGAGNDVFVFSNAATLSGSLAGGGGANTVDESSYTTPVALNIPALSVTGVGTTYTGIQTFIGGTTAGGTLTGPAAASTYNVTSANAGNVGGVAFSNYSNLVGGAGNDIFKFAVNASLAGGINGGGGTDAIDETAFTTPVSLNLALSTLTGLGASYSNIQTITPGSGGNTLTGPAAGSTYNITGANAGNVAGFNFTKFGSLVGGPGNDMFKFVAGGSLTGGINGGGGNDTIDDSSLTAALTLNLATSTITLVTGSFSNIQNVIGGTSTTNQIIAQSSGTTFNITGANIGNAAGIGFTRFGYLVGGAGNDVFKFSNAATLSGTINGGAGTNTIDQSAYLSATSVNLQTSKVTAVGVGFTSIQAFIAGVYSVNQITGPNAATVFNVTAANKETINGITFSGFGYLVGGTANDSFVFSLGASLTGSINGGTGTNTLDLSAFTKAITVNMSTSSVTGVGSTFASIQTFIGGTNTANSITGPAAATTFNITALNTFNANGLNFSAFRKITGGAGEDTFVLSDGAGLSGSIDGGAGNNWLDYSAYTTGVTVNLATGAATGFGAATANIVNVRGGSGNDTLTGNTKGNILIGGAGNDTLIGGSGRSILIGGTGVDTVTGGSGDDIVIGGTTSFDNNNAALDSILAEWQSATDSYATRINFIKNGGGLNGTNTLNLGTTVIDDLAANVLTGGAGNDWFFQGTSDTITDLQAGEQVN